MNTSSILGLGHQTVDNTMHCVAIWWYIFVCLGLQNNKKAKTSWKFLSMIRLSCDVFSLLEIQSGKKRYNHCPLYEAKWGFLEMKDQSSRVQLCSWLELIL